MALSLTHPALAQVGHADFRSGPEHVRPSGERETELSDKELDAVHESFIDSEAGDLIAGLHTAARDAEAALTFVREWSEKLAGKEAEASEAKAEAAKW